MRRVLKQNCQFRLTIKHPTSGRVRYKIERREKGVSKTLKLPQLDALNRSFKAGKITAEEALKNVLEIREQLYLEAGATTTQVFSTENQQIANDYWKVEYESRELVDPSTARYEIDRAVAALGTLSLRVATAEEIGKCLKAQNLPANKYRRIVAKLRLLLKHIGRTDVRLYRPKPEKRRVRYLSEAEFRKVLPRLVLERLQVMHEVAFYTGARLGEMFAMEPHHFNAKKLELQIEFQMDKKQALRDTKNRRGRTALVFPQGVKALKKWFELKHEIDLVTRKGIAEITKNACKAEFPKDPRKHLTFHALRHCYAVMLRESGLTTEDVADLIGDSIIVAKEHYSGFGESSSLMDLRREAIISRSKKAA